jgi:hypothetical protein
MVPEDVSVYKVSRRIDFFIGFGSTIMAIIGLFALLHIGNEASKIRPIVGIICLSIVSILFLTSYFLVNEIKLTSDRIVFRPCGHEILLSDIDTVKNASSFRPEEGAKCPPRIELTTNVNRLKWTPLNVLWVGEAILIRSYGFSASRFVEELESKLPKQRRR